MADAWFMHTLVTALLLQALLHCAKNSMNMLKNRIQSRTGGTGAFLFVQKPFFEVGVANFGGYTACYLTGTDKPRLFAEKEIKISAIRLTSCWAPLSYCSQVDVQLEPPARVSLMPSLDDIQECINKSAQAILGCFKQARSFVSV